MAVTNVTTSTFTSAYNAAAAGDTLVMAAGTYTIPSSFNKRLILQATDWAVGKNVTGTNGHNGSGCAVKVQGRQNYGSGAKGTVMRGIYFDSSTQQSGAGSHLDLGGVGWEDCVFTNRTSGGVGMICVTLGSSSAQLDGSAYMRRCRMHKIGDSEKDHALYHKNIVIPTGEYYDEDCLFYNISGYSHHWYGNPNNASSLRAVSDRNGFVRAGGITFSGANDSSTGFSGCFYTRNCRFVDGQITNTQHSSGSTFGCVESWWGCTVGSGNAVVNTNLNQANGVTSTRIKGGGSTLSGVTLTGLLNVVPGYADPTNGDFTLPADSPALGLGPVYIQPDDGPAPPPSIPPNAVTGLTATVGVTSQRVTLNWTNPGGDWDAIMIRRGTSGYPATFLDGTGVYDGTGTTVNDDAVNNGSTYYYSAFVRSGELFSAPAQVTATPAAPVVGGSNIAGKTTPGTAGFKGMTPDVKRGWLVPFGANKKILMFRGHLNGNGAGTGAQSLRAFAYNATAGANSAMPLMVVSAPTSVPDNVNNLAYNFILSADYVLPAAGGQMVIGLISGPRTGTATPAGAEVRYSYDVQAGALHVNNPDAYADGPSATWGTLTLDTALGTLWAVLDDVEDPVEEPPNPVADFTAAAGDGKVTLAWVVPVTPYDSFVVRRSTSTYPTTTSEGVLAYQGTANGFTDTGLPNGTQQFYSVFVERDGLYSGRVQATATPITDAPDPDPDPDPPPPPPPSQGLLAAIDQSIVYLEDYLTTATAAMTASGLTVTRDDDDLAVSNYTLATDCLAEVRRARALLFRMAG